MNNVTGLTRVFLYAHKNCVITPTPDDIFVNSGCNSI